MNILIVLVFKCEYLNFRYRIYSTHTFTRARVCVYSFYIESLKYLSLRTKIIRMFKFKYNVQTLIHHKTMQEETISLSLTSEI